MCSARSRTSARASISPSSAGVSRTATAPGPERLEHQAERGKLAGARGQALDVGLVELDDLGDQQDLARDAGLVERGLHALVDEALVRGVLVDDDEAVARLRHDVGLVQLRARGAERPVEQIGRGLGRPRRARRPTARRRRRPPARPRRSRRSAAARRASGRARIAGRAGERRQSQPRRGVRAPAGTPRSSRCRRSSRRAGRRAPAPPAARAISSAAHQRRDRGSAPRPWPDAR